MATGIRYSSVPGDGMYGCPSDGYGVMPPNATTPMRPDLMMPTMYHHQEYPSQYPMNTYAAPLAPQNPPTQFDPIRSDASNASVAAVCGDITPTGRYSGWVPSANSPISITTDVLGSRNKPNVSNGMPFYVPPMENRQVSAPLNRAPPTYTKQEPPRQAVAAPYYADSFARNQQIPRRMGSRRNSLGEETEEIVDELAIAQNLPTRTQQENDTSLPIANIGRLMKSALPSTAKIAKQAKEMVRECVTEFIQFIVSEAGDRCMTERRKTLSAYDILNAVNTLGFVHYNDALRACHIRWRELRDTGAPMPMRTTTSSGLVLPDEGLVYDLEQYARLSGHLTVDERFMPHAQN